MGREYHSNPKGSEHQGLIVSGAQDGKELDEYFLPPLLSFLVNQPQVRMHTHSHPLFLEKRLRTGFVRLNNTIVSILQGNS